MGASFTLGELAEKYSVELKGSPDCKIDHVAPLESAGKGAIAFLSSTRYKAYLSTTGASAVIVSPKHQAGCAVPMLLCNDPYVLYAKISNLLAPALENCWGSRIHPSAVIHDDAEIDDTVRVGPLCVIEAGVSIAANCVIGPSCVLEQNCALGEDSQLAANVTIGHHCKLGKRVIVHSSVVVGSDGFGFANELGKWIKIAQVGIVDIGDDVEIGAGSMIDRGANRDTVIEAGVKLDNIIHVAHNVRIGAHTAIAAMTGIAGTSNIGKSCTIGGRVSVTGQVNIPDKTHINAVSVVNQTIDEAGSYASGTPLEPVASWRRNRVRFKQLDDMAKRLKAIELKLSNKE